VFKAASLYDKREPCGAEANAAKYLAAEACFARVRDAMLTHAAWLRQGVPHRTILREAMIPRLAPVSPQLISLLHRREGAGAAEVVLRESVNV